MALLHLLTLGPTELRRRTVDGRWDVVPVTGKPLALLIRVAAAGTGHPLSRDVLAEELWSDIGRERAKAQFRTALWALRKHVPDELIRADDATISLDGPIECDRTEFQAAVRARALDVAVDLYRGDFLAHFAVSAARGFEEWAELERRNLRGLFAAAAEAESRQLTNRGRFSQAVSIAERARDAEPLSQGVWCVLLQALISAGDVVRARAEANALLAVQADESFDLDQDTRRLVRLATKATPEVPQRDTHAPLEAELVGRERELAGLLALVEGTDRKQAAMATVVGPPGIGKTRLLRDFARSVAARRGRVVTVSAARSTERVPYGWLARLAEVLAALPGALGVSAESAAALIGLHPSLSAVFRNVTESRMSHDHRFRMLAVAELVRAVADEARLTVVVDDAQWLDEPSRQVLESLPTLCAGNSLLVVLGERTAPAVSFSEAHRFTLVPLSAPLTEALVGSMASLPEAEWAAEWVRTLHVTSAGVPLAVLDVVRLGIERSLVEIRDHAWNCPQPAALIRLTEEAAPRRARIAQLPALARELAVTLGLAGGPIDLATAAAVLHTPEAQLVEAADILTLRGIGHVEAGIVALDHEEYGAAARQLSDSDMRVARLTDLATRMVETDTIDSVRRAYWLADEAGAAGLAERIAARYLTIARAANRGMNVRAALAELVGIGGRAAYLDALANRFDVRSRWRRRATVGAFVLLAAAVAVLGTALAGRHDAPADAALSVQFVDASGAIAVAQVPLRLSDWVAGRPIPVFAASAVPLGAGSLRTVSRSPVESDTWLGVTAAGDTLTDEVTIVRRGVSIRTLASAPNDDIAPAWSPDGRRVVFVTARWNGDRADLAIVDIATDSVTRLGGGPGMVTAPAFSADGAGVVFTRAKQNLGAAEVCVLTIATRRQRCRAINGSGPAATPAWPTARSVYFGVTRSDVGSDVEVWDLQTDSVAVVAVCPGGMPRQQALGLFIVCATRERSSQFMVAPSAHPEQWRTVEVRGTEFTANGGISVADLGTRRGATTAVRIRGVPDVIVNVEHALRAEAIQGDSAMADAADVTWSVLSGPASISNDGVVTASAPGGVVVRVAGSNSADTLRLTARPARDSVLLDERWGDGWPNRWRLFGVPTPQVVHVGNEAAFWNAGDGTYFSGAYSRRVWETGTGLAIDVELSTPLNADKRQLMRVGFRGAMDEAALTHWDDKSGYPPGSPGEWVCIFQYPSGQAVNDLMGIGGSTVPAPRPVHRGDRFRLRIQILPDGRCAFALNGRPMDIETGYHARPTARVLLDGASVGTKMLVHDVVVRRGVPSDIDWRKVRKP